jgi:hypothetical protein
MAVQGEGAGAGAGAGSVVLRPGGARSFLFSGQLRLRLPHHRQPTKGKRAQEHAPSPRIPGSGICRRPAHPRRAYCRVGTALSEVTIKVRKHDRYIRAARRHSDSTDFLARITPTSLGLCGTPTHTPSPPSPSARPRTPPPWP